MWKKVEEGGRRWKAGNDHTPIWSWTVTQLRQGLGSSADFFMEASIESMFPGADRGRCSSFDQSAADPARSTASVRTPGHHNGRHCNSGHAWRFRGPHEERCQG